MKVCHTEHMAEGPGCHPWEDWVWDETVFEGTAAYYRQGRKPYAPALADALAEHLEPPHLFGDRLDDFIQDLRRILLDVSPEGRFSVALSDNRLRIRKPA